MKLRLAAILSGITVLGIITMAVLIYVMPGGQLAGDMVWVAMSMILLGALGAVYFGQPSKRIMTWLYRRGN